jgi:hypothetical protein
MDYNLIFSHFVYMSWIQISWRNIISEGRFFYFCFIIAFFFLNDGVQTLTTQNVFARYTLLIYLKW